MKCPFYAELDLTVKKVALCFKHLIPQFMCIDETDVFLLNLRQNFQYHPLDMSFFRETQQKLVDDPVVPVCPSMTN